MYNILYFIYVVLFDKTPILNVDGVNERQTTIPTFVISDGDDLFFGRSFIIVPPSKTVDIDIRDVESSDIGLQHSS